MLVTFKSRLYFAAVLMFFIILVGDFIVINYINTFRNSSYTQSVISSTISSLLKIQRNAMGIVYLSKLRKADIKIAKSEKKTFNSSAIDKKIAGLVKEIKKDRVSVLPSIRCPRNITFIFLSINSNKDSFLTFLILFVYLISEHNIFYF